MKLTAHHRTELIAGRVISERPSNGPAAKSSRSGGRSVSCYLARFTDTKCMHRADGIPDRAHCVPQQRIRQAGHRRGWSAAKIAEATWDDRVWVPACRHHHGAFDGKIIRLAEDQYPPAFREWAREYSFEFRGLRDGWVALYQPPKEAA